MATTKMNAALAAAITNDRRGIVSAQDARRVVDAGVGEILGSTDPRATFEANRRYVEAAERLVGSGESAARELGRYEARGKGAIATRMEQLTGEAQLPVTVEERFNDILREMEGVADPTRVKLSNVRGNANDGYSFDYAVGRESRTAYAVPYRGELILTPTRLDQATLDAATRAMRATVEEEFADMTGEMTPGEVAELMGSIVPERAMFPGESSDPYGYVDEYPALLVFANPTGSDHGFYVGIDPARPDDASAYTFN